jgi:hypothetical protein
MADSRCIDPDHRYAVAIPATTPGGQPVTVQRGKRGNVHVLHAESPDQSELYFEVTTYRARADHGELIATQQQFLRGNAADAELTKTATTSVGARTATTFDFKGTLQERLKARRFLFVDGARHTYRIVYDHTSPLNETVFQSLEIDPS